MLEARWVEARKRHAARRSKVLFYVQSARARAKRAQETCSKRQFDASAHTTAGTQHCTHLVTTTTHAR